jgi:hypothetical protein
MELDPAYTPVGSLFSQNGVGDDEDFSTKRINVYPQSSVELTKEEVGKKIAWTLPEIEAHKKLLIDIGLKVFRTQIS